MGNEKTVVLDGNEAAAYIAYQLSEVVAIYPITPSSAMGEWADSWASRGDKNIWGNIPHVYEMQSEAGAAGTVHGACQAGALSTTFTASQGLLLMIPNMYKLAGELTPVVFHVAARSLATHALSIFGDHSDVMATRQTGFAMLCSNSVQEVMDMALIAHLSSLTSTVPFLHFFDGFRTSHEVGKISLIEKETIENLLDDEHVFAFRKRGLSPDNPFIRGTAQNPDVFFQARERSNPIYNETPEIVQDLMDRVGKETGRSYKLFEYLGDPEAERIIIIMGSGAESVEETINYLDQKGEKVGMVKVRLFRPFSIEHFVKSLPKTTKSIAVLDRTKEQGAVGDPLYLDIVVALNHALQENKSDVISTMPKVIGGRYGLSSKEFTPAMVLAIYKELESPSPKNPFTIGIHDDVTGLSLEYDKSFVIKKEGVFQGIFWGMGSDGTVGANKNSIKIIGEETSNYTQGYFVYDSKKSGSYTTSHLRFGEKKIHSSYLINEAGFVACHQFALMEQFHVLEKIQEGGTFLLNTIYSADQVWEKLPLEIQKTILDKNIKFYVVDGAKIAKESGLGRRISTIMQTCFFSLSDILPKEQATAAIKKAIHKTFARKGTEIVEKNYKAVDNALTHLYKVEPSEKINEVGTLPLGAFENANDFMKNFTAEVISGRGNDLPVSMMPLDGTFPSGTTKFEKRNISDEIPVWDESICIQCGKCAVICPHGVIRIKAYDKNLLTDSPDTFKSTKVRSKNWDENSVYTIQVAPEDCTGCELCVEICPAKNKSQTSLRAINMAPKKEILETEKNNWDYFLNLPEVDRSLLNFNQIKDSQLLQPLFEFSGACSGCGETPYIKLVTQLFGDRMLIANATGCSSIYGGNLPTTPYTKNDEGLGPAWSNSLFEDNAEFGLGFRLSVDKKNEQARELLSSKSSELGEELCKNILSNGQFDEADIFEQRKYVKELKDKLEKVDTFSSKNLLSVADYLVKKSVWIFGGDGWAYDIGYGGVDHVMASGKNVNILVMDTEVYSNTGGQKSKATPIGAVAKFAMAGKSESKKDLALLAMGYGNVYVAKVCLGANDTHTLKALIEAEKYDGPSLIIAYSPCIAHGYDMKYSVAQSKLAVESGHWHLFRYHPDKIQEEKNPFQLDSKPPRKKIDEFMSNEGRFRMLKNIDPKRAKELGLLAQKSVNEKFKQYENLSKIDYVSAKNKKGDS